MQHRLVAFALSVLLCHCASLEHLVRPTRPTDNDTTHPFSGSHAKIDTLKHILYCGKGDLTSTPKCIKYNYDSNALVEAFLIDGDAYQRRVDAGLGLVSKGIVINGSFCMGLSCQQTVDLQGVKNWCLMFLNVDSDLIAADIRFQYEICLDNKKEDHMELILEIACLALIVIVFFTCIGCCYCLMIRRRRERQKLEDEENKEELLPLLPPPPPLLLPPPMHHKGDVYFSVPPPPPMVAHADASFRHEPSYQMQPPLPISHVPLSPSTSVPENNDPRTLSPERRPRTSMGRRSRSRSRSRKIRFPI